MQKKAARRGQRALAFLLCLLMVVTLLPVMGASAAEGDVSATGVELNKTLTLQNDGTYAITLEAYATGTVTTTTVTEPVPTDFVLVLDQSGSMDDNLTSYTYTARASQGYSYSSLKNQTLYYKDGDTYYQVSRHEKNGKYYLRYEKNDTKYYLTSDGTTTDRNNADYASSSSGTIWTGVLYTRTETSQTKLAALKTAVTNFVNSVKDQKDANGNPVDHRIAIVGFGSGYDENKYEGYDKGAFNYANTELFIGSKQYNYAPGGKESNQSQVASTQYGNALQRVNDPAGSQNLTDSINALAAFGGTYPQLGFEMANGIFKAYRDENDYQYTKADGQTENRGTVVVMFTDGEPGTGGTVNTDVANATMQQAKTSKNTYGAKVFTIGVFDSDNSNLSDINTYMNAVSSNRQPTASETPTMTNQGGTAKPASDPTNYYAMATDSEALNAAFQSVSSSVNNSSTSCELDTESVLTDVISGNLDLPANFSAVNNVKVYTATCSGTDEDGKLTWEAATPFNATVTTDDKAVNVSGFDYSQNYVTGEPNTGRKLIVTITGLLPNQDGTALPSNEATSGIYDDGSLVAPFKVPTFDVGLENRVVDFGMTVDIAGNVLNTNAATNQYGTFALDNEAYTYNLNPVSDGNGNYTFGFTGVDSSLYFADGSWNKVNVIPANNVYYDDAYLNGDDTGSSTFTDGKYGYEANVDVATSAGSFTPEGSTTALTAKTTFNFTGSRIDLYCTTTSNSNAVVAALWKAEDFGKDDTQPVASKYMINKYESGTLYNVPTLSFDTGVRGNYVLVLYANGTSNYQFDGVRVYNPADETNDTVKGAYTAENEANAQFLKVRDLLVQAGEDGTVTGSLGNPGVVYTDEQDNVTVLATYYDIGPKNEVYLAANNGVSFKLDGYNAAAYKVMVGLSAPEGKGNGQVTVTYGDKATTVDVKSVNDMYYEVTPDANGNVSIVNSGNVLVSVTNIKVTARNTASAASTASVVVDEDLLNYVSTFSTLSVVDTTTPDTPDPIPDTPVQNDSISAIIHAIWAQVKDSIDRLFGRL
ncbi:MAG: vWA domain-containing protein [Oscillospiraceae bacterium]